MDYLKRLAAKCGLCFSRKTAPPVEAASGGGGLQRGKPSVRVQLQIKLGGQDHPVGRDDAVCDDVAGSASAGCSGGLGYDPAGRSEAMAGSSDSSVICDVIGGAPSLKEARHVAAALALELLLERHSEAAERAATEARGEPWRRKQGGGAARKMDRNAPFSARFVSAGLQEDADGPAIAQPPSSSSAATGHGCLRGEQPALLPPGGRASGLHATGGVPPHIVPFWEPRLTDANKGYGLLKKAGWQEGSGLGLHGQGASLFLAPASQQHIRGLGFQKGGAGVKRKGKAAFGSSAKKKQRR